MILQADCTGTDEEEEVEELDEDENVLCSWELAAPKVMLQGLEYEIEGGFSESAQNAAVGSFGAGQSLHDAMARAKLRWYKD